MCVKIMPLMKTTENFQSSFPVVKTRLFPLLPIIANAVWNQTKQCLSLLAFVSACCNSAKHLLSDNPYYSFRILNLNSLFIFPFRDTRNLSLEHKHYFCLLCYFFRVTSNNLVYITVLVVIVKTFLLPYSWGCLFLVSVRPLCSCSADFIIRFIAAENTITYNRERVVKLLSIF